jgi:chemotaxis protein CheD
VITSAPGPSSFSLPLGDGLPVPVGPGEARALTAATHRGTSPEYLVTYNLDTAVALCLFERVQRIAGMVRVMLPGADRVDRSSPLFAGTALDALLQRMHALGAAPAPENYLAVLIGGMMLPGQAGRGTGTLGALIAGTLRDRVQSFGSTVAAEDLGGTRPRIVWFDPREDGLVHVHTMVNEIVTQ